MILSTVNPPETRQVRTFLEPRDLRKEAGIVKGAPGGSESRAKKGLRRSPSREWGVFQSETAQAFLEALFGPAISELARELVRQGMPKADLR